MKLGDWKASAYAVCRANHGPLHDVGMVMANAAANESLSPRI